MPHRESRQAYNKPHRSSFPLSVCCCLILHCFLHQHARFTPTCYSRLRCSMSICAPWSCAYVVTVSQQAIHHVVKPQQEGYRAFGLGSSFNPHYPSITCTLLVACAGRDLPTSQDVPPTCTHGGENTRSLTCEDNVSGWIDARLPRGCIPVAEFDIFIYHWRVEVQGSHLSGLQISDLLSFDLFWLCSLLPSILTWITNFVNFLKCCLNKDWLNGWGSWVNPNLDAVCVGWRATNTGPVCMAMKIILFLESSDHSNNQVNRIIPYIYVCVIGLTQPDSPMDFCILAMNLIRFVLFYL